MQRIQKHFRMEFEVVIGLEVHVQLKTKTKIFASVPYKYGEEPNTLTNPVIMGLPGTLPVMNKAALDKMIQLGLIFNCKIADRCKWDRKNYFYPDNPKNYQISQYDQPLCEGGSVEIELEGESRNIMGEHKKIALTRIHLEEDVGKLTHYSNDSLVDYNRAGCCLAEIVSEPDMRSPEEAVAYLNAIRTQIVYAGLSDCDMEKGQMRCDANISVRPMGQKELGTKVELKNMNTMSGVKVALEYEIKRQIGLHKEGRQHEIVQETRRWDPNTNTTSGMRSKEQAHDYRYFPDPDLMPVEVDQAWIDELSKDLPEAPFDKQRRFQEAYKLPYTITSVLCPDKELADYFEKAVASHNNPKAIANLIANDLLRELSAAGNEGSLPLEESKVTPTTLAGLVAAIDRGDISNQIAKDVFIEMFKSGETAEQVIERKGLKQSSDKGELEAICQEVIENNPKPVAQFKEGKEPAINALKGQVMKATKGQANPKVVDQVLRQLLQG